ncbi:nucleolar pre-ribosomal-associated protein 1 [Chytriomyces hyalinus]|nr:nucleolar pre-ribosomal-associated protein 1 [Chytriomyces hyalinus]
MKWSDAVAGDSEAGDSEHENESDFDVMEDVERDEDEYGREKEDADEEDGDDDDDQEAEWTRKLLRLDPASAPAGVTENVAEDDEDDEEEEDGTVPDRPASTAASARRSLTSSELATILASDNVEVLIAGFIRFNYALKRLVRHAVDHEVSDESSLVRNYVKTSPETPELIRIWQFQQKHNIPRLDVLVLDAIGYILLASRMINARSTGTHLARTMIRNHMKPIYKALSSKKHALMQAACRVLSALVIQSSSCTRELFESFNFTMKALPTLFKIKKTATDGGRMEDIRGLYIRFLLGFLMYGDANVKKGIMETKDAVSGIFKGCWEDHYSTLEFVFSVLKKKVVDDTGLSRSVKQQFFNNYIVELITKLYGRSDPTVPGNTPVSKSTNSIDAIDESLDTNEPTPRTVADLAHEFLIHLCTRPGFGICVQEPGWLQIKKLVVGDAGGAATGGRLRKQKNSHLIKWAAFLRPTEIDLEMTALLELLKNCPELVQPYLAQLTLSFEPRLSSKWIKNMALLANIISLPVPDLFSSAKIYIANPSTILAPPTVSTLAENILPNALNRLAMGRALQHPSVTVRHISAFVLGAALGKLSGVLAELDRVALHVNESKKETDGAAVEVSSSAADEWINLKEALVNEIRRRVPEVQLVLGLYMKLAGAEEAGSAAGKKSAPASKAAVKADEEMEVVPSGEADMEEDATVTPIVIQCASLRLIREYQNHFPEQMAESRFDYGKLVPVDLSSSGAEIQKATLEFLIQVPQFKWWTNPAGSQNSHLQTLMKLYCFSDPVERAEIKALARKVVAHFLTSCYIFQNSLDEVPLWLDTVSEFSKMSSSFSNAPSVISWFDAACCSAIKSPHKAIDRMSRIVEIPSSLSALERQTVSHMYDNRSMQSQVSANVTYSEEDGDLNADLLAFRDVFPFSPVFACAMDGMLALLKSLQQKTESGERAIQILGIAQSFCVVGLEILCGTQAVGAFMAALLNEGIVTLNEVVGEVRTKDFTASLPYSYMVLLKAAAEGSVLPLSNSKTPLAESDTLVPLAKLLSLPQAEQQNLMISLINVAETDEKAKAQLSAMCFILSSLNEPLTEKWVLSSFKFLSPRALVKGLLSVINASAKVESEIINQLVLHENGSVQLANTVLQWLQSNASKTSRTQVESAFEILAQILSQAHTIGGTEWSRLRDFVFRHPLLLTAFASTEGIMFSSILGLLKAFLLKDFSKSTETVYEDYINQVQVSILAELSPGSNYAISPSTLSAFALMREFMPQTHLNRILDAVLTIPVMNDPNQTERQNRLLSLVLTSSNVLHVQEQRVISMQAFLRLLKLMHDCPSNELDKIFESAVLGSSHLRLGVSTEVIMSGRTMPIFAHVPSLLDMDIVLLLVNQPTSSRLRVLKKLVEWSGFVRDFVLDRVGSLKSNVAQSVFESALSSLTVVSAFSCDWVENTSDLRKEQISKLKHCADVALTRMADRVLKGSVTAGEIQSDLLGQSNEIIRIVSLNLMGAKQTGFFNKLVADYLLMSEYANVGGSVFWLNQYFDALIASEMAESKAVDLKASIFTVFIKSLKLYFHSRKRVELPIKPSDPQYVFEKSAVELLVKVQSFLVSTNTSLDVVSNGFTSKQSVEILGDFIKVGLKYRMLESVVVELLGDLVQMLYMKMESRPIPLDQLLSMISGHSQFKNIIKPISASPNNTSKGGFAFHPCKAPVVRLLRSLINHADNETIATIRSTILPGLSTSYSGTRHESDREILSIWQLYENRYGLSVASNAIHWGQLAAGEDADPLVAVAASSGATGNVSPASAAESLSLIDSVLMARTIHAFPIRAELICSEEASDKGQKGQEKIADSMEIDDGDNGKDDANVDKVNGEKLSGDKDEIKLEEDNFDEKSPIEEAIDDLELYDTSFFLPLIAVAVKVGGDKLDVKKLVETNALGLAVMALASQDENIRKAGYFILDVAYTGFYKVEDLKEKLQLTLLLTMLKNGITDRNETHFPKLPTIIALFFSNALAILSKPEHFMYPLVNSFLLSRPTVDFEDVPMFYSLFNSSTANCRRERVWLYRLLCGGLKDPLDYRLYKRRHVIDLMMSFFHFPLADVSVRKLTFEFLFTSVKISAVVTDMVNERGLLTFVTTLCSNLNFNPNNEVSLALPRLMRHIAAKWYGSAEYQRSNKSPIAQSKSNAWTCAFYTCCVSLLKTIQRSFFEYAEASRLSEASDETALTAYTWWITLLQESIAALRTIVDMSNAVANSFVVMKVGEISQLLDFIGNIKKTCTSLDPTKRLDTPLSAPVLTIDSLYSVPSSGSVWHLLGRLETDLLAVVVQGPALAVPPLKLGSHGLSQSHLQSSARALQWACDLNDRGRIESQKERKAFFAWILSNIVGSTQLNGEEGVINHLLQALFAALVSNDSEIKLLGIRSFCSLPVATTASVADGKKSKAKSSDGLKAVITEFWQDVRVYLEVDSVVVPAAVVDVLGDVVSVVWGGVVDESAAQRKAWASYAKRVVDSKVDEEWESKLLSLHKELGPLGNESGAKDSKRQRN